MKLTPNQREALNIDRHICVTAGAGSGKTTVLVERYLRILKRENTGPHQIVAITFTEKAAAEMKGRIIKKLDESAYAEIRNRHIEQMNTAAISTIHAFCARILREFPFQAAVPANFSIVQGIDQKLMLKRTIQTNLKEIASNSDHENHDALRISLQRYGNRKDLVDLFTTMIEKREIVDQLIQEVYFATSTEQIFSNWEDIFLQQFPNEDEIWRFLQALSAVLQLARGRRCSNLNDLMSELESSPDINVSCPDTRNRLYEIAGIITTSTNSIAINDFLGRGFDRSEFEEEISTLETVATRIKSISTLCSDDVFLLETTRHLLNLYQGIQNDYQNNKLAQGTLDFTDLQLKTRDLLQKNNEIRRILVERYDYYMIDEFQDTNELQYELIKLLTNDLKDANLFIVGDPKQSIFGFQGADVRVFDDARQKIEANGGQYIKLMENFRSLRIPVGFVNHFFNALMGDGTQSEFDVPFESLTKGRVDPHEGAVEIIFGQSGSDADSEYKLIARHINRMIADGVKYDDIAILIRSRNHLPDLEEALISERIPYLTTGGIGFYQRQEIYDIWNYLHFLNTPEKHHTSLVGILRGPAFGISDTELYEISHQNGQIYWEKANNYPSTSNELRRAIDTLSSHMHFADRLPINLLIQMIVNETGLIGALTLGRQGQQKWANYQKLLDLARQFDSDENKQTLVDFTDFLDILINDEPREGQAPLENTEGAIQIMTIHSAKGKEFSVVILPCLHRRGRGTSEPFIDEDIGIGFSPRNPDDRYAKTEPEIVELMKQRASIKDEAEKKRLFYVGATRAKDRLILSGALNHYGNLDDLMKWLFENLGISEDDELFSIPVKVDVYSDQTTTTQQIDLQIPIIKRINDDSDMNRLPLDEKPVNFPELPRQSLKHVNFNAAFSVTELANYVRCPLRYQLEHVIGIPSIESEHEESIENELDAVIRDVISQTRLEQGRHNFDLMIDRALENYPELINGSTSTGLRNEILRHIQNYADSEIAELVISSSNELNNRLIYSIFDEHILSGRIDKMVEDSNGQWQGVNFVTYQEHTMNYYEPEMELIGLLLHRSYPEQPNVTVRYFRTQQSIDHAICFNQSDLQEISNKWFQQIASLQQEIYTKNLTHCSSCKFADSQGLCIVN